MALTINDRRTDTTSRHPVAMVKLAQFTWASGASAAVAKDIPLNGRVRVLGGVANNSTNGITYTTTITTSDSLQLYTKADWAENATEIVTLTADTELYIPDGSIMTITPSGDPGESGGTFDITLIGV